MGFFCGVILAVHKAHPFLLKVYGAFTKQPSGVLVRTNSTGPSYSADDELEDVAETNELDALDCDKQQGPMESKEPECEKC